MPSENGEKLSLRQAIAMSVGGMIGGGIFAVLGIVVELAGHSAAASFALAGLLGLATAHAYARLAVDSDEAGGAFTFLRQEGWPRLGAWLAWLLALGYVFTMSVYAFTFGHYLAFAVDVGVPFFARAAGLLVLALFVWINLRGVSPSGLTEEVIVAGKMVVLLVLAGAGLAGFASDRLAPPLDEGWFGILLGASVVFMAFEGFQLLLYNWNDIEEPRRNVPLALYLSVPVVVTTYVLVTVGSQMLVPDRTLAAQGEVALAVVGREALGAFGFWFASLGAVLSTGSAINATLFATARLVRDVSDADELPDRFAGERDGLPVVAIIALGVLAGVFSLLPNIEEIVAFGSLTFLVVFGTVNLIHARTTATNAAERLLAYTATLAAFAAAAGLVYWLATRHLFALAIIAATAVALFALRFWFERRG